MTGWRCILRPATPEDADAVVALLLPHVQSGLVLPRSPGEIREHAGNFIVAVRRRAVVGCVALRDYGAGLYEIRSLTVAGDCAGQGLGSRLVRAATRLAIGRGASRVFVLTLRRQLFQRLGFREVDKELFPQKVWTDCRRCAKREQCDEIALLKVRRARGAGTGCVTV